MGVPKIFRRYESVLEYALQIRRARESLIEFARFTMPDGRAPNNPNKSKYMVAAHHEHMAFVMEKIENGEKKKVILNAPPRHGKSEICTRRFAAWYSARNPDKDVIVATYGEGFAADFGKDVRGIIRSPRFKQVFPEYRLITGGQSDDHLINSAGGNLYFLGRRSPTTGRGADLIIVDDPTKDDKEAVSTLQRDDAWSWFSTTLLTRHHTDQGAILISQTRWNEDDICGRLTDPSNPAYSERFAKGFEVMNFKALAGPNDFLGRDPGEALWPDRFNSEWLEVRKSVNPASFSALYQCSPTPDDGSFYSASDLVEYDREELPENLRIFVASDHALTIKQKNDRTAIIPFGVDEDGTTWILPDVVWRRMESPEAIEVMLRLISVRKPLFWYSEKGQIASSLQPILLRRMAELELHCPFVLDRPATDKLQRAHSARSRCAAGKIKFPRFASWWQDAKNELLKFPNARHDDFVDALSLIGLKMNLSTAASTVPRIPVAKTGTFAELFADWRNDDAEADRISANKGW